MSRLLLCFAIMVELLTVHATAAPPEPTPPAATITAPTPPPVVRLSEKLPIETFAQLDFIDEARLSPHGQRIAGLLGIKGEQAIAIINLFDKSEKTVGVRAPEDTQVDWVRWVNDDNIIVGLRALLPVETEQFYVTRVIAINRLTGKVTWLLRDLQGTRASNILYVPRDGSTSILIAGSNSVYNTHDFWPKVYRVDVATGRASVVLDGSEDVWDWYADQNGVVRMGSSYDDDHYRARTMYRGENGDSSTRLKASISARAKTC